MQSIYHLTILNSKETIYTRKILMKDRFSDLWNQQVYILSLVCITKHVLYTLSLLLVSMLVSRSACHCILKNVGELMLFQTVTWPYSLKFVSIVFKNPTHPKIAVSASGWSRWTVGKKDLKIGAFHNAVLKRTNAMASELVMTASIMPANTYF